jgi:predicted nucleic acid-binding protein
MAAVSDSSPLITYAQIGRLDLLRLVFGEILIPPAIWQEVVSAGRDKVGSLEVSQASWIQRRNLPDIAKSSPTDLLDLARRRRLPSPPRFPLPFPSFWTIDLRVASRRTLDCS